MTPLLDASTKLSQASVYVTNDGGDTLCNSFPLTVENGVWILLECGDLGLVGTSIKVVSYSESNPVEICGIKVYGYDNVGTSIPAVDNSGVQVVDYGTAISIDIDF